MTYRTVCRKVNLCQQQSYLDHTHPHNHIPPTYKYIISCQQSTRYCGVLLFNFRKSEASRDYGPQRDAKRGSLVSVRHYGPLINFEICCDGHLIQNKQETKLVKESQELVG